MYLAALTQAGKCPYGFGSQEEAAPAETLSQQATEQELPLPEEHEDVQFEHLDFPSEVLTCPNKKLTLRTSDGMTKEDYKDVMKLFWDLYDQKTAHGQERMTGCLLRTAGHDLMDFRLKLGED